MITLGIDTTAAAASVAIVKDGHILCEYYTNVGLQHSRTLMPMVEGALTITGLTTADIDRFGVTVGPGSFTGVRIGVSAVKGLSFPHHTPCVGVSTLEALACNLPQTDSLICPVMDARCSQVYNALFCYKNGRLSRLREDRAISIAELFVELVRDGRLVTWLGDGATLCYNTLTDWTGHALAPEHLRYQRASNVALLSEQATQTVEAEQLAVSYLRPPQAVRTRMENNVLPNLKG